ncbi:MAG TPA: peptidoglycan editing factor PgeF [Lysobacter sp.]|nr:peptidoglycan editing factor PgeF [Lysobacter sp.]
MSAAFLPAAWPAPKSVHAFTTLRHGLGVSQAPFDSLNLGLRAGDDQDAVLRNRELLVEHAGLPTAPNWLRQVHGTEVWRFEGDTAEHAAGTGRVHVDMAGRNANADGDGPQGDASVTSTRGTVLAILTADCMPVLFCAKDGSEVAAAHAGWRGLAAGVLESTVAAMRTPSGQLIAWLGPAAGPRHYEIGVEVYDAFVAQDWPAGAAFTSTRPHHWKVDLYALARRRLERAGMAANDIHGGDLCTISDPQRFYSHRRDQRSGRMASLIWLQPRQ